MQVPQGELGPRHAVLAQSPQHIALVFVLVLAFGHIVTAFPLPQLGIVARGDEAAVHLIGPLEQGLPLDMGIAEHTGVGRATGQVLLYEVVDDIIAKFLPDIDDKVVKTEVHGHLAGIIDAVQAAAARLLFGAAAGGIIPCLHGDPHHLIPLLMEHDGAYGTVDTAAHGHQNLAVLTHRHKNTKKGAGKFRWRMMKMECELE